MWSGELEEAVCNNQALQCERSLIELQQFHIGQTAPHMHQWSLLHFAAEYNAFDAALVLFSHGADPHAKDQYGGTPLHIAARFDSMSVLALLLEKHADVNAQDEVLANFLALFIRISVFLGPVDVWFACRIMLHQFGWTPLIEAAYHNRKLACKTLLEHGASLDARTFKEHRLCHVGVGATVLQVARARGFDSLVELLALFSRKPKPTSRMEFAEPDL
eukprot:m.518098 g.518098  ORF g.518098 m.518098 type:complete len:218 (+) comp57483_c0_seq26:868-1521(+)